MYINIYSEELRNMVEEVSTKMECHRRRWKTKNYVISISVWDEKKKKKYKI